MSGKGKASKQGGGASSKSNAAKAKAKAAPSKIPVFSYSALRKAQAAAASQAMGPSGPPLQQQQHAPQQQQTHAPPQQQAAPFALHISHPTPPSVRQQPAPQASPAIAASGPGAGLIQSPPNGSILPGPPSLQSTFLQAGGAGGNHGNHGNNGGGGSNGSGTNHGAGGGGQGGSGSNVPQLNVTFSVAATGGHESNARIILSGPALMSTLWVSPAERKDYVPLCVFLQSVGLAIMPMQIVDFILSPKERECHVVLSDPPPAHLQPSRAPPIMVHITSSRGEQARLERLVDNGEIEDFKPADSAGLRGFWAVKISASDEKYKHAGPSLIDVLEGNAETKAHNQRMLSSANIFTQPTQGGATGSLFANQQFLGVPSAAFGHNAGTSQRKTFGF